MKICAACFRTLPKDKFNKKQWQSKNQRRCKECIADNRGVELAEASNDTPLSVGGADGEGAPSWTDEDLFKQPPPNGECPICFHTLPLDLSATKYHACCGKRICLGCIYSSKKEGHRLCPFCRARAPTSDEELIERIKKRVEVDDAEALYELGCDYYRGELGLRQNQRKAMKLCLRAGDLGHVDAYCNVGYVYEYGENVKIDMKKSVHFFELAAMRGSAVARYNLGNLENRAGNMNRAVKHWMISAAAGDDDSLTGIRECFQNGHATKDDFEKALRAHKNAKDEMWSHQREAAAAAYGFD